MTKASQLFKKDNKILVLDIGTETVKALIFKKEKGKIIVLGHSLQYFESQPTFTGKPFEIEAIKKTILSTIKEIKEQDKVNSKVALITLPPRVLKGKVIFHSIKRKKPGEVITKKEEGEIKKQVLGNIQKEISESFFQETGIMSEEVRFIETKILEMKINGYNIPCLKGYKGENIEFMVFSVYLAKNYFETFKEIIKDLKLKKIKIIHEVQNLVNSFNESDALFVDIGGDVTQVFLIKKKKLYAIEEFNIGGRNFSQSLSNALGIEEKRGKILKEKYSNKQLSEETRKKIKEILNNDIQDWFSELRINFKKYNILLPRKIYLFGGGSLLSDIEETLCDGDWGGIAIIPPPEPKLIFPADLLNVKDKTKKLNNSQSIPLLLLCYAQEVF